MPVGTRSLVPAANRSSMTSIAQTWLGLAVSTRSSRSLALTGRFCALFRSGMPDFLLIRQTSFVGTGRPE